MRTPENKINKNKRKELVELEIKAKLLTGTKDYQIGSYSLIYPLQASYTGLKITYIYFLNRYIIL